MLPLLRHVIQTSARRDRTELNDALLDAFEELFQPLAVAIHRCYGSDNDLIMFTCAGLDATQRYVRNAYLPDREFCQKVATDPLLDQCRATMVPIRETLANGAQRHVFPVCQSQHLLYLIDLTLTAELSAAQMVGLMGVIEYFANHISLLDYGETDTLTRLANRKTFDKHLFEVLGAAHDDHRHDATAEHPKRRRASEHHQHWLAVCDIDHFKSINDNHGHLIGDEVLITLAQLMRKSFRFDDQLFRFGGEEFVVVLQPSAREHVTNVFNRFRQNVEKHRFGLVGHVSISIGVTGLRLHDLPTDAIGRADEALYFAKQHGRNQVQLYEDLVESGQLATKQLKTDDIELF